MQILSTVQMLSKEEYELQEDYENLKKKKITAYDITFDHNGNLNESFVDNARLASSAKSSYDYYHGYVNKPNEVFQDCLVYVSAFNNRVYFKSSKTGQTFNMFLSDFNDVVRHHKFGPDNKVTGRFVFCKKGIKQGVRFVFE
jgi:hypothetical protein